MGCNDVMEPSYSLNKSICCLGFGFPAMTISTEMTYYLGSYNAWYLNPLLTLLFVVFLIAV